MVGAVVAALAGVLSHGAGFYPWLDLIAHFAPVYMAVALGCMVIAILTRLPGRGVILVASAVAIVAGGVLVGPEVSRSNGSEAPFDREGQIKVIQINALRTNADIGRVADWLIAQDPDVVTVSEARHDLRDLLVRRAGWSTAGAHGSLMIFTREPYVKMDRPRLRAGGDLSFVNATYATPRGPIEIVTTHLDWPTSPLVAGQVRDLEDVVGRLPRERMILTGDFNAAPWSAELRRLDTTLGLVRRDRAVATWPAQLSGRAWRVPILPIDHIYAGRGWSTVKVERGPWLGSDHYPLVVTLAPVVQP
ncbi:MAG: endonuclease [Phenylobacterium sp.]|uniref:endonuclease/exonuclease/phosphatase family protein n=1 Tax=Phenylobacterium sp. TaxID=1871053 RepID=UPI0012210671|nr:endonuclease/exonuclease/phosphatase family protein [Phenylobacterium sp.]TAJ71645.1 MAG: endonuclease [Phenylobacterium sp.]